MEQTKIAVLFALVLLVGCGSLSAPDEPAAIEGTIVARNTYVSMPTAMPAIHVKSSATDQCGIIFSVNRATIAKRSTGDLVKANEDDLTIGKHLRVWTNIVLDSCPGQAGAEFVEVIE
jgi:hypothetical protein